MVGTHRILAITSEPGEESWAFGAVLARYADEGSRVHLICATLGERGRFGASKRAFPPAVLGRMRERELEAAAAVLGVHETEVLGYPHGAVDSVDPFRVQMELAARIRRIRPQVVVTFGAQGPDGDPDRMAVADATQAAILAAARHSAPVPGGHAPHAVRKAYQRVWSAGGLQADPVLGSMAGPKEEPGAPSIPPPTPEWMISTVVGTGEHGRRAVDALACHRSRPFCPRPGAKVLHGEAPSARGSAEFIRSLSTVVVPSGREEDLLAGIRRAGSRSARAA